MTITTPPARFTDLLAAEWLKLWSLRSIRWALLATALVVVGMNVNAAWADHRNWPGYSEGLRAGFVPTWAIRDAFTDPAMLVLVLAAGTIGAITLVGEYSTGLIRTTFAAVPARRAVTAAKLLVLTPVMAAYGTVLSVVSFWLTQAVLSGRDAGLSFGYPGVWRALAASALLPPVCAVVGLGIGALVRHAATTVAATVAVLLLLPMLFSPDRPWTAFLHHALPVMAWGRLTDLTDYGPLYMGPPVDYPATVTGSWIALAAWPLSAALLALWIVDRCDV
ncbi:hypothetical protein ACFQY4_21905 [Catellatospora bangladeshensis]|uniref:ABC transporter permease n=1 Tax=Catellatospora bangladeshensis TaxID=310355 RepID=A0A8J3JG62_9ACTN|nr:hypothetical protein [Catellatospora bangladeshensis]GIF84287.1 hypothetical protein Cba03nite_56360 [Catellatospora bangladeshensis]